MPTYTCAQAVAEIRRHMNSIDDDTALEYMQQEHNELAVYLPINITDEDVSITAGTRQYALNALTRRLWKAVYMTSATEGRRLKPTSVPRLNADRPNWEFRGSGTPIYRYTWLSSESLVLGLDPKPDTNTSGTYPLVRCTVSRSSTLTSGGNLPANLLSYDCYVFGALLRHARAMVATDRVQLYEKARLEAFTKEQDASFAAGFGDVEDPPALGVDWLRVGGAV